MRDSESLREPERARESESQREPERAKKRTTENQKEQGKKVYQALHIMSKERLVCSKTFKHGTFCHKNVFCILRVGEKIKMASHVRFLS